MGNFNRGGFGGGRGRSFGPKRSFNDRGPREMHKAICSNCGKECEVPFRPTGEKPVYCRDCFQQMNGGRQDDRNVPRPAFTPRNEERPQQNDQLAALSAKVDRILSILEKATSPAPKTEDVAETQEVPVEKKKRSPKKAS